MKPKLPKLVEKKLGRQKADGQCPWDGTIEIDVRLRGKRRLETMVHELLHHLNPGWNEEQVDNHAKIQTAFLWKNRVRIVDEV